MALERLVVDLLHGAAHLPVGRRIRAVRPEDVHARPALEVVGTAAHRAHANGERRGERPASWCCCAGAWRAHKEWPELPPASLLSGRSLLMGAQALERASRPARETSSNAEVQVLQRQGANRGQNCMCTRMLRRAILPLHPPPAPARASRRRPTPCWPERRARPAAPDEGLGVRG